MDFVTPLCGEIVYSRHAEQRRAQRSVREELVELLLTYAWPEPAGGGCLKYRFDKDEWYEACEFLGARAAQLERFRHAYLIEDGCGMIITVAWEH